MGLYDAMKLGLLVGLQNGRFFDILKISGYMVVAMMLLIRCVM